MSAAFASPSVNPAPLPTQAQMFYAADRTASVVNQDFLWLVQNGLTKEDLQANIKRRPSLWSRFEGFVDSLPSRETPAATAH